MCARWMPAGQFEHPAGSEAPELPVSLAAGLPDTERTHCLSVVWLYSRTRNVCMFQLSSVSRIESCSTSAMLKLTTADTGTTGFSVKVLTWGVEAVHSGSPLALRTKRNWYPLPSDVYIQTSISVSARASSLPVVMSNSTFPYVGPVG